MKKNSKRVAIIGAGIIGTYLAWKLGELGHKVFVFEKEREIKDKACSTLVSERIKEFIPISNSLIENKINFCIIHFPKKAISLKFKPIHYLYNRKKIIKYLINISKNLGVKFFFNKEIKEIPKDFDKIIGCDGTNSITREKLNLGRPNLRLGLQLFLNKKDNSDQVEVWPITPHHFSLKSSEGFFWKIPRGNKIEYGAIGSQKFLVNQFEKFCENQKIHFNKKELKLALIPNGLVLPDDKNTTLCGEAAGLSKLWSGGGIIWGLIASQILIKNFQDFRRYKKEVFKNFRFKILRAKIAIPLVYFFGYNFPYIFPREILFDNDFLS